MKLLNRKEWERSQHIAERIEGVMGDLADLAKLIDDRLDPIAELLDPPRTVKLSPACALLESVRIDLRDARQRLDGLECRPLPVPLGELVKGREPLARVGLVEYYEHPKFGDEVPLIAALLGPDDETKVVLMSENWEVPGLVDAKDEAQRLIAFARGGGEGVPQR